MRNNLPMKYLPHNRLPDVSFMSFMQWCHSNGCCSHYAYVIGEVCGHGYGG